MAPPPLLPQRLLLLHPTSSFYPGRGGSGLVGGSAARPSLILDSAVSLQPGCSKFQSVRTKATENDKAAKKPEKASSSLICKDCEGNGAILCNQCEGSGVNSVDHFNGRFKAGALCWLCRGKREILCGSCNGAGFLGGFLSTFDETAE